MSTESTWLNSQERNCSKQSVRKFKKIKTLLFLLFIAFQISDAGNKKKVEKIVIHVPYKVHKHHHTHTKYKVITIPAPKKESTIIYYKPVEPKPEVKLVHYPQYPPLHMELKPQEQHVMMSPPLHTEIKPQEQQIMIPPHQASIPAFLKSLHKPQVNIQKPIDMQGSGVVRSPIVTVPHEVYPSFIKYEATSDPHHFYPKSMTHHSNEILHVKLPYKPNFPMKETLYPHSIPFKPLPPSQKFVIPHDNIPHASNQVVITARPSKMMKTTSYAVKEPSQEEHAPQQFPPKFSKQVPFMNLNKNFQHQKSLNIPSGNVIEPDSEYEHVGYLLIDGHKRKVVDKNFKEEVLLKR